MKKSIATAIFLIVSYLSYGQFGVVIVSKEELYEYLDSSEIHYAYDCADSFGIHLDSLEFVGEENYANFSECHNDYNTVVVMIRNFLPSEGMFGPVDECMSYVEYFQGTMKPDKPCVMFFLLKFKSKIQIYMQYYY